MSTKKVPRIYWLTTGQIARHCHVTPETVANWIKRGQLKAGTTPGGHYRVPSDELANFCKEHGFTVLPEWVSATTPPTILLIDDDPDIVETLVPFLSRADRRVIGSSDVAEAGIMLMKYRPDLVILDLHLPGTDGIRIASMLRKEAELSGTRIIVLSGYINDSVRDSMKDLRIDRFFDKPPNLNELSSTCDELVLLARDDTKDSD